MPPVSDRSEIRAVLETDRVWAVYALGDLAPGHFEHCEWHILDGSGPALVLLYRAFEVPVVFALGPPGGVAELLGEAATEPAVYLSLRPEALPALEARYEPQATTAMWRMVLDPARFGPAPSESCRRLAPADLPALRRLYADGEASGEAPDFFTSAMLASGVFYGIHEDGALVSAAGTHLVALEQSVAAIGNVYTRRDRRGRGLASRVTSAVAADLLRAGVRTIALNVAQANAPAVCVYERLGFDRYCPFVEGEARGAASTAGDVSRPAALSE